MIIEHNTPPDREVTIASETTENERTPGGKLKRITVSGPRGIGKTAIIEQIKEDHARRGYLVFMSDEISSAALAALTGNVLIITEVTTEGTKQ